MSNRHRISIVGSRDQRSIAKEDLFAVCHQGNTRQTFLYQWKFYKCTWYTKIIKWFQKLPNFYMRQFILSIGYRKILKSNPNSIVTFTPNLIAYFSTLWFFFADVSICKHWLWQNCQTHSSFYHNLHIWYHEILTNLIIFILYLIFLEF